MKMIRLSVAALSIASLWSCGPASVSVTVTNPSGFDRNDEIVEVDLAAVSGLLGDSVFVVESPQGTELPVQLTYDGKIIFPATVAAGSSARYTLRPGTPSQSDTVACGAFYPLRKDDFTWENDRAAYRAYGPALQASGERAFGYDVWTKSVSEPVVAERYRLALEENIWFHDDHGNGLDVYTVGPTLGCGTPALLDSTGNIVYPWAFESFEILDNGPLRFTARFTYPEAFTADSVPYTETRLVRLDAGDFLNRSELTYAGLDSAAAVAGIVVHRQNPDAYVLDPEKGIMAYSDLTDNPDAGNGVIYLGLIAPKATTLGYEPLQESRGDAVGHILAGFPAAGESPVVYYWGSGWSKGGMPDADSWTDYLRQFRNRIDEPLQVTIE